MEKGNSTQAARADTTKELGQINKQLKQVKDTVTKHTTDIAHIKALLEDCESVEEESISSGESSPPGPESEDPPEATPQGQGEQEQDVEMRDEEADSNPTPGTANQSDPQSDTPPEAGEEGPKSKHDDVIVEEERIVIEAGGATPITPADDGLLDDQKEVTGAETPSRVVAKSLSQMNMDSPASTPVVSDPPGDIREA